jgi:hypothetical protein
MTYVIGSECIDAKDRACLEQCPVDCIYEVRQKRYINPAECIDREHANPRVLWTQSTPQLTYRSRTPFLSPTMLRSSRIFYRDARHRWDAPAGRRRSGRSVWTPPSSTNTSPEQYNPVTVTTEGHVCCLNAWPPKGGQSNDPYRRRTPFAC